MSLLVLLALTLNPAIEAESLAEVAITGQYLLFNNVVSTANLADMGFVRGPLSIIGQGGETLISFYPDGRVVASKNMKPDEAAREVLRTIGEIFPSFCKK